MSTANTELNIYLFDVGDRVVVQTFGSEPIGGTITQLWSGSPEEKASKRYGLDKFHVVMDNGGTGWFYRADIQHSNIEAGPEGNK
jgi:ABC-type sulfate transport system substrate-binding protein